MIAEAPRTLRLIPFTLSTTGEMTHVQGRLCP